MNPITLIAFGITGDLMRQKILPALFMLHEQGTLPKKSRIIGVSRRTWKDNEFETYLRQLVLAQLPSASPEALKLFIGLFKMVRGDVQNPETYKAVARACAMHEEETAGPTNRLLYLAIEPALYLNAVEHLAQSQLLMKRTSGPWTRIVLEKPFGLDLTSAQKLQEVLLGACSEGQIYRVDHYLAKKSLETIPPIDFSSVKEIAVRIMATTSVETRGVFYDSVGELRDMIQNHVLEVLACTLLANEPQGILHRNARARTLEKLPVLSEQEIAAQTTRAQYPGYKEIAGVSPSSTTETHCSVRFILSQAPWSGVSVLLESGKKMPVAEKEIILSFKDREPVQVPLTGDSHEYEVLLRDCIGGNPNRFVSQEEVIALWRFIDPIKQVWQTGVPPLSR